MNKVLIAFMSGIAVGILIAPDKGSSTREKLVDSFNDIADTLSGIKEKFTPETADATDPPMFASSSIGGRM